MQKHKMQYVFLFSLIVFVVYGDNRDLALTSDLKTFSPGRGPNINPMRGWSSSWGNDHAYASVGFQYVGWKAVEPENNVFVFSAVEDILNLKGSKGRHVILRLFADWGYKDTVSNSGPAWLYNQLGVKYLNNGTNYVTDYNNPIYIAQAIELIQAFGKRYNNDPRIYAIQLGILGYWGEWHTSSYGDYTILDTSKQQILDAYLASFPNTLLVGRQPWIPVLNATTRLGFHNDYFYPSHRHSDKFDDSIDSGKKWLNGPIGGATPPAVYAPNSTKYINYDALYRNVTGENMIKKGHYSTLQIENACDDPLQDLYCKDFMRLHRMMGYNYQLTTGEFPNSIGNISTLRVWVRVKNIGVAIMYYNWKVEMALLNPSNNNSVAVGNRINTNLKSLLPQNEQLFETTFANMSNLTNGEYQLALRISQPGADVAKGVSWGLDARNVYVEFANNNLTVLPAYWNPKNALIGGWTILGSIKKTNI